MDQEKGAQVTSIQVPGTTQEKFSSEAKNYEHVFQEDQEGDGHGYHPTEAQRMK